MTKNVFVIFICIFAEQCRSQLHLHILLCVCVCVFLSDALISSLVLGSSGWQAVTNLGFVTPQHIKASRWKKHIVCTFLHTLCNFLHTHKLCNCTHTISTYVIVFTHIMFFCNVYCHTPCDCLSECIFSLPPWLLQIRMKESEAG